MRFVMSNRRAGKFEESAQRASRSAVALAMTDLSSGASVVHDSEPTDPTLRRSVVFEADPLEVQQIAATMSKDVMIEPEILHFPDSMTPMDFLRAGRDALAVPVPDGDTKLVVNVRDDGTPLRGAEVILFLRGPGNTSRRLSAMTATNGRATFNFPDFFVASAVLAVPAGDHWAMFQRGPSGTITVECPPLPQTGPIEWWHRTVGADRASATRGRGIRVGVIDSGVGPHPCLDHVTDIGSFINGFHDDDGGADSGAHGSHVSGTIGSRPQANGQFAGIAPGCTMFSARVFPPDRGANQLDIADAIDMLSINHRVDLINMSLGAKVGSQIEQDAIKDALERGTLCVCAAGNSSGPVEFPAAFPETVAISAVGLEGWGPAGSIATTRLPQDPSKFGNNNLYLANFSCFGSEITGAAPGVGIISTVPERFGLQAPFGVMGGTSMASPIACGALATLLGKSTAYKGLPRDGTRSAMALAIFRQNCRDIGLDFKFQGHGVINI